MPAEIRSGESAIRKFAVDFLERKRPELLAILADKDLHSDLLKETPQKIKHAFEDHICRSRIALSFAEVTVIDVA